MSEETVGSGDVAAIVELVHRLAWLADEGTIEEYLGVMTDDVTWQLPTVPATGLIGEEWSGTAAIGQAAQGRRTAGTQGPDAAAAHVVSGVIVDLGADGVSARARSVWRFYVETTGTPRLTALGRYDDTFRLVDGVWKISSRVSSLG